MPKKIKIILVEDDELFALEVNMMLDEAFDDPEVLHFTTAVEVRNALSSFDPDVMLVDVVLEDEQASIILADFAKAKQIPVVFMTAFKRDELFKMALKVNPSSYLQKPFSTQQLKRTLELAMAKAQQRGPEEGATADQYVLLKGKDGILEKVALADIYLLEAFGNYCHFHTLDRRYTQRMPLKRFQEVIHSEVFVRIHRNYVINLLHLTSINVQENIVVVAEQEFSMSQRFKAELLRKFPKLG
ncbi:MAG: response regulator transcription factor [Bacteroidota bacterium]